MDLLVVVSVLAGDSGFSDALPFFLADQIRAAPGSIALLLRSGSGSRSCRFSRLDVDVPCLPLYASLRSQDLMSFSRDCLQ
jgi:hypothetical protein